MMEATDKQAGRFEGIRGIVLIAVTYVYFLIFAQFGFLKQLAEANIVGGQLKIIMAAMAAGGIAVSLLGAWLEQFWSAQVRLRVGLIGCAIGATISMLPLNIFTVLLDSLLTGAALGLVTVTLVTHLKSWIGERNSLLKIGLGVGLAYFLCNCPLVFEARPAHMAMLSATLCLVGAGLARARRQPTERIRSSEKPARVHSFWFLLGCFTALVWLDSAAFYIIQNTPALKSGTWEGGRRLWENGTVHLLAAIASAVLLSRKPVLLTLSVAFATLTVACLLLVDPGRALWAHLFYPMGVSLYSVALVGYPSCLSGGITSVDRARIAGRLYAIAGWIGSALGIGMAEHLHHIPKEFVLIAGALFVVPWILHLLQFRRRETLATASFLLVAGLLEHFTTSAAGSPSVASDATRIEHGRQVYISEGCINCHSQYVRPHSKDELIWGPSADVAVRRAERPPLIGNRRQGPDLTEVGARRSDWWLTAHFMNPAMLSHDSLMPSYGYLFDDDRGADLVAYVKSLGQTNVARHLVDAQTHWHLATIATADTDQVQGAALLQEHCSTCHAKDGPARHRWQGDLQRLPPDLFQGAFTFAPDTAPLPWRRERIAQIIKFGLPGTNMPGHEYLSDFEIAEMVHEIIRQRSPSGIKDSGSANERHGYGMVTNQYNSRTVTMNPIHAPENANGTIR